MLNGIILDNAIQQAKRLNALNISMKQDLEEHLGLPVFMQIATESEIPEDYNYIVVETDDYDNKNGDKMSVTETVSFTLFQTNRPDPTLDHLLMIAIGQSHKMTLEGTVNNYIVMERTGFIVNACTITFTRGVKVGC